MLSARDGTGGRRSAISLVVQDTWLRIDRCDTAREMVRRF
jgi:hypothetical protein